MGRAARRSRRVVASWLTVALTVGGAVLLTAPGSSAAVPLTIGGYVFYDRDADGHRDPGEPGLAGLRVHHVSGAPVTTTDADGHYLLTDLPDTGRLILQTGWLRSQCYDPTNLNCAPGPGDDNDFPTRNQLFELPLAGLASAEDINAALLPDWPGAELVPPAPVDGVTPANPVDVAARLSAGTDTCTPDAFGICEAGDTFEQAGQIHNQGTRPLTRVRAKLFVPPGDCLTGVRVVGYATSEGVGAMTTSPPVEEFGCDTREVELSFAGSLAPGGVIRLAVTGTVQEGPGTPGCTTDAPPAPTCSTAAPQGRTLLLGVSHVAERGDPDSDFCARGDLRQCATALHDKRREPDEVDPAGHNVAATLGGTTDFNLRMRYSRLGGPPISLVHPGDQVTVRGWVRNQIGADDTTNQAHSGAKVRLFFPPGTAIVALPARHALRDCTRDAATPDAESVTCVFNSPLAPYVSSLALDVVVEIPAYWPAGRPFHTVACAQPVDGQAGERLPPSDTPCDPRTIALATPTDNDAELLFLVVPHP